MDIIERNPRYLVILFDRDGLAHGSSTYMQLPSVDQVHTPLGMLDNIETATVHRRNDISFAWSAPLMTVSKHKRRPVSAVMPDVVPVNCPDCGFNSQFYGTHLTY